MERATAITGQPAEPAGPAEPPTLVFVGGTGRSGTHVVADLLDRHSRYAEVPIEARFHVNPAGFPDLLAGRVSVEQFLRKLRRFWWYRIRAGEPLPAIAPKLRLGRETRGLHQVVPRQRFDAAVRRFELAAQENLEGACRELFCDLLRPLAEDAGKRGLVEMSCFTIAQAPTLLRLFPEARFVHTVRDGRDAGSSKVSKRQKREHPREPFAGLDWWAGRLAEIEAGVRETPPERILAISLDELVAGEREETLARLLGFLAIDEEPPLREFFEARMSADAAHRGRWREGLDDAAQERLVRRYEEVLDRLERESFHCAPLLRRAYERLG